MLWRLCKLDSTCATEEELATLLWVWGRLTSIPATIRHAYTNIYTSSTTAYSSRCEWKWPWAAMPPEWDRSFHTAMHTGKFHMNQQQHLNDHLVQLSLFAC